MTWTLFPQVQSRPAWPQAVTSQRWHHQVEQLAGVVLCCSNCMFLCSRLSLSQSLSSSSCLPLLHPFPLVPSFSLCGFVSLHQVSKWLYRWSLSNLRYGRFLQYVHFFFLSVCLSVCSDAACWLWCVCMYMSASVCPFRDFMLVYYVEIHVCEQI